VARVGEPSGIIVACGGDDTGEFLCVGPDDLGTPAAIAWPETCAGSFARICAERARSPAAL
jgi:hypothetical protein